MLKLLMLIVILALFVVPSFANSNNEYMARVIIEDVAKEFNQDASIIYAIAKLESGTTFNPDLVCYNKTSRDRGIMQINNRYEDSFKKGCEKYRNRTFVSYNVFNPQDNITLGTYIFWCTSLYEKNLSLPERLTIYNGGYGYLLKYGINKSYVNAVLKYRKDYKSIDTNQRR